MGFGVHVRRVVTVRVPAGRDSRKRCVGCSWPMSGHQNAGSMVMGSEDETLVVALGCSIVTPVADCEMLAVGCSKKVMKAGT